MMQNEFEKLIGAPVTSEELEIINHVYTFHPLVKDVSGKQQIAEIYLSFGFGMIKDMVSGACKGQELEDAIQESQEVERYRREDIEQAETALKHAQAGLADQQSKTREIVNSLKSLKAQYQPKADTAYTGEEEKIPYSA